jgi:hypothetical protein
MVKALCSSLSITKKKKKRQTELHIQTNHFLVGGHVDQVVEHFPNKHKALSSNVGTTPSRSGLQKHAHHQH